MYILDFSRSVIGFPFKAVWLAFRRNTIITQLQTITIQRKTITTPLQNDYNTTHDNNIKTTVTQHLQTNATPLPTQ